MLHFLLGVHELHVNPPYHGQVHRDRLDAIALPVSVHRAADYGYLLQDR